MRLHRPATTCPTVAVTCGTYVSASGGEQHCTRSNPFMGRPTPLPLNSPPNSVSGKACSSSNGEKRRRNKRTKRSKTAKRPPAKSVSGKAMERLFGEKTEKTRRASANQDLPLKITLVPW